ALRRRGLELAVVSNWDVGLTEHVRRIGAGDLFATVVTSAEAGAAEPDPAAFGGGLERLRGEPAPGPPGGHEEEVRRGAGRARRAGCGWGLRGWRGRSRAGRKLPRAASPQQTDRVGDPRLAPRAARLRQPAVGWKAAEGRRLPVLDGGIRARPVRDHPGRRPA